MKNKRIAVLLIINVILVGIICNLLKGKVNIIKEKQLIKEMTETEYDSQITELNKSHTNYAEYIETCKETIANAITDMGIETESTDTIDTMANNIRNIKSGVEPLIRSYTITLTGATNGANDYGHKTYYTGTLETIEGYTPYTAYIYSTNTYRGGVTIGSDILQISATAAGVTSDKTKAYVNAMVRNGAASDTKTTIVLHVLYFPE